MKPSKLTWKRGIFGGAFQLFRGHEKVGILKPSWIDMSANGQLNNIPYHFKTSELRNQALVIQKDTQAVVAKIRFSNWMNKATIEMGGKKYQWKFSNLWETRWKIINHEGAMHFQGHTCKGSVDFSLNSEVLALAGLFIGNYFWNMAAIYAVVLIPIFTMGAMQMTGAF